MKHLLNESFWQKYQPVLGTEYDDFLASLTKPLPKTIRLNTLRDNAETLKTFLQSEYPDWQLTPHPFGGDLFIIESTDNSRVVPTDMQKNSSFIIHNLSLKPKPLGYSLWHQSGLFYLQEASSALPAQILNPKPGQTVLDLCAAPGSKTTQLAALMQNQGMIIANELSGSRSKALVTNLSRCGVSNTVVTNYDGNMLCNLLPEFFDKILLDAPCTGEGTVQKDADAVRFNNDKKIIAMSKVQLELLESAIAALKIGGEIVYSTCTLDPRENELLVTQVLEKYPQLELVNVSTESGAELPPFEGGLGGSEHVNTTLEFTSIPNNILQKTLRIWPHRALAAGFFVSKFRKTTATPLPPINRRKKPLPDKHRLQKLSPHQTQQIQKYLQNEYAISLPSGTLVTRNQNLWLLPNGGQQLPDQLKIDRAGLLLGKLDKQKKPQISYEFVMALPSFYPPLYERRAGGVKNSNILELSKSEALQYLRGQNLNFPPVKGELRGVNIILTHQNFPLGTAKLLNDQLKNQLPRHMVTNEVY
jgi:16S rRNA (cytosine1407-C5)-methyltransferase